MSDLDKLFGDFESRKQDEQEAAKQQRIAEDQARDASVQILQTIILPVIREISNLVVGKGHESEVRERFDNYTYPSVELTFKPTIKSEDYSYLSLSTLAFVHTEHGRIKIRQEVKAKNNSKSLYDYNTNGEWELSSINQEKVRSRAMSFIEAVLKAN